ncbi:hypothetical protein Tco_0411811 [Tanacetum coccineum]
MIENHWMDKLLKEVLMIDELSIVETDKVNHTVEMDMLKLVVEVECFGKCVDEFDKVTVLFGEMQLKQEDRSYVHASNELHLHVVHVVPSSDQGVSAADPGALSQGVVAPSYIRKRVQKGKRCSKGWKKVFHRLRDKGKKTEPAYNKRASSKKTEELSESEGSAGGHWKSKLKRPNSSIEDDLSQPWVCEEIDPFTPRIRYFDFPKTRMPSHIKTYDRSKDPEDHLKIFQSAAKTERWAMPTWCYMFNSTLTGNARQKKCIKDPVEIHNIRQRDRESTEEFVRRYKLECGDVKGAPECMKISGFDV